MVSASKIGILVCLYGEFPRSKHTLDYSRFISIKTMLLVFLFILITSVLAPGFMVVVLILNTGAVVFLSVLQITIALFSRFEPKRKSKTVHPFVSVLVPAYNEPPVILMQTLEALLRLDYDCFEVLVIDNNTRDKDVWMPVKIFVEKLGKNFRFFHKDHLSGFKAGALNYALERVNEKSEYAAVIDADYAVEPDFLNTALSYFAGDKTALVQFPQEYRNCNNENQPIADEYRHFFKIYMNMANHLDCVPSTGTVSIYRLDVLREIGGFRKEALTEDADVGLRIYAAGYHGVYVDRIVGYGLMPYDLEAYRKQKWRWAFGNAQSMKTLVSLFGKIPFRSWFGFLAHLTAWDHLNFLPFAVLGAYSIVLIPTVPITELHKHLLTVASFSIFIMLASKLILFAVALRQEKRPWPRAFRAFLVHMGMTLVYSEAWIALLLGTKSAFERTNKFILASMPNLLKNSYKELILGVWFLIGTVEAVMWGTRPITVVAFFVSALMLFCVYYVYWKISPTKAYSKDMLSDLERKYRRYLISENA